MTKLEFRHNVVGAIAMFITFFMSAMTIKAVLLRTVTSEDIFIVLSLMVIGELVWNMLLFVYARKRKRRERGKGNPDI